VEYKPGIRFVNRRCTVSHLSIRNSWSDDSQSEVQAFSFFLFLWQCSVLLQTHSFTKQINNCDITISKIITVEISINVNM